MKVTIELKLYDGTWIPKTIVSMVPFRSWNSLVNSQMDILKLNDEEIRIHIDTFNEIVHTDQTTL